MRTVTINELAGYLPHELKVHDLYNNATSALIGIRINEIPVVTVISKNGTEWNLAYTEIKPIVYPLSRLTTPITHKGETFIPHERLGYRPNLKDYTIETIKWEKLPHDIIQKLHEWHFWTHSQDDFKNGLVIEKVD